MERVKLDIWVGIFVALGIIAMSFEGNILFKFKYSSYEQAISNLALSKFLFSKK